MKKSDKMVDWHLYAEKYDMLLSYNPFYQTLRKEILALVGDWDINDGDVLVDVGAGTGNYSVFLAGQFPQARVIHIDNNEAMNERAIQKKREQGITNLDVFQQGIEDVDFKSNSVSRLVSVHALYTFPNPQEALRKMYGWLKPGGKGILVDPGRIVNVIDWQIAIASRLIFKYGLAKTLQIFREATPVSRQNKLIRQMQHQGKLWTHTTEEFCRAVKEAGFVITEFRTCFRGLSDMVVVTKE